MRHEAFMYSIPLNQSVIASLLSLDSEEIQLFMFMTFFSDFTGRYFNNKQLFLTIFWRIIKEEPREVKRRTLRSGKLLL